MIGIVGKHAVHAQLVKALVFGLGVALVVAGQALGLAAEGVGVHEQARLVRVVQHRRVRHHGAVALVDGAVLVQVHRLAVGTDGQARGDQIGLPGADAVGVFLDVGQAGGRQQRAVVARIAGHGQVVRLAPGQAEVHAAIGVDVVAVDQLHQAHLRLGAQVFQVAGLERLDDDGRILLGEAVFLQDVQQTVFQLQAQVGVVSGVLGLGVDADGAFGALAFGFGQRQHFLEGRDGVLAVVALVAVGHGLDGAQRLQLGQREVADEPAFFFKAIDHGLALAAGKFGVVLDVGGGADVGFVARHQHAVFRGHQVGLDEVGAQLDGLLVALQRVVGQVAGSAPVADDERLVAGQRRVLVVAAAAGDQGGHGDASERAGLHQGTGKTAHRLSPLKKIRGEAATV